MNRTIRSIFCIILAILLIIMLSQTVLAVNFNIDEKFSGKYDKSDASKDVTNILSTVINLVQIVGAGVAIIMLISLGIQYVTVAKNNPNTYPEYYKKVKVYILGAVIIFAAVGILQIIKKFAVTNINGQLKNTSTTP